MSASERARRPRRPPRAAPGSGSSSSRRAPRGTGRRRAARGRGSAVVWPLASFSCSAVPVHSKPIARRQGRGRDLLHRQRAPCRRRRPAPGSPLDRHRAEVVVAHDRQGPTSQSRPRRRRRSAPSRRAAIADVDARDVLDRVAVRLGACMRHPPGAAEEVEVVDVDRPERRLQRGEDDPRRDAERAAAARGRCRGRCAARSPSRW